jgi:AcrR family transcriptional regulator
MGYKERKAEEKKAFRQLIIDTAHELLVKQGLQGLTMRALAKYIEYSQSKIYEFFKNKDELCEVLCEDLCKKMLAFVENLPKEADPYQYLTSLITKVMAFHADFPHSDELLTLVCFGPQRFKIPEAYKTLEALSVNAVKNLNSPYIQTEEEIVVSLDAIRCVKIGVASLMSSETSVEGRQRIHKMAETIIQVLIRGWK